MKYINNFKTFESNRIKRFGYIPTKFEPLENLVNYKKNRRLRVYLVKGVECSNPKCNIVGTQIVHSYDKKTGKPHIDVCDDNLVPLTVDHIIPKVLGGTYDLINLEPMCSRCNGNKGHKLPPKEKGLPIVKELGIPNPYEEGFIKNTFDNIINYVHIKYDDNKFRPVTPNDTGKVAYKLNFKSKRLKELGTFDSFDINNHHPNKEIQAVVNNGDKKSYYPIKTIFVLR